MSTNFWETSTECSDLPARLDIKFRKIRTCDNDPSNSVNTSLEEPFLRICTWNLLAPCWNTQKRFGESGRAVETLAGHDYWRSRLDHQIDALRSLTPRADVVLLQEVWFDPTYLQALHESADSLGYDFFASKRTRGKEDGLATLVLRGGNAVFSDAIDEPYRAATFNDAGDRIVSMILVEVKQGTTAPLRLAIGNTHFTFPHPNAHDPLMRIAQAGKAARWLCRAVENGLADLALLGGDLNGEIDNAAIQTLLETYFEPHNKDAFVSHIDHNGKRVGCDFVMVHRNGHGQANSLPLRSHSAFGSMEKQDPDFLSDHRGIVVDYSLPQKVLDNGTSRL